MKDDAVNVAFVEKIFFENCDYIVAQTSNEKIVLKSFEGTAEKNLQAAKNYLLHLTETLNAEK